SGDHHIHTRLCNHAHGEMEDYVQAAINKGLLSMTFLEHLECGIYYDHRTWLTNKLFAEYFREGKRLQKKYAGQIDIRLGVEVGYNPAAVPQLKKILARYPFEHVGLSYHFYFDGNRHLNMVSHRQDNIDALATIGTNRVLDEYFNGLIRACKELPCDKICHLDAGLRHTPELCFTKQHREQIEQLLVLMQKKKIALEVNTSGIELRSSPYPAEDIVKRAHELKIPLIAGSDAHRPDQVGRYFMQLSGPHYSQKSS
ncbi:MAG: histidinol-phosphatase, partial [Deltaproteobacteria bacterium]|nr:histidinol-phosphatase [Deltaproteobacteria bacterium]